MSLLIWQMPKWNKTKWNLFCEKQLEFKLIPTELTNSLSELAYSSSSLKHSYLSSTAKKWLLLNVTLQKDSSSLAFIVSIAHLCFKLNRNTAHLSGNVFLLSVFSTCNLKVGKKP